MTWRYSMHCYASLGQLALLRGDADAARRFAEQSLEAAHGAPLPQVSRPGRGGLKGESATARHAWGEAEDALRRALAIAEAIGQPRQTWQSHAALARLHAACGRADDARAAIARLGPSSPTCARGLEDPGLLGGIRVAARDPRDRGPCPALAQRWAARCSRSKRVTAVGA